MELVAVVPLLLLLLAAMATRWQGGGERWGWAPAWLGVAAALFVLVRMWGQRRSAFGVVDSDPMGQLLGVMVLLGLAVVLHWIERDRDAGETRAVEGRAVGLKAAAWALFVGAGALGLVSTRNLLVLAVSSGLISTGLLRLPDGAGRSRWPSAALSLLWLGGLATLGWQGGSVDLAGVEAALLQGASSSTCATAGPGLVASFGLGLALVGVVARLAWLFHGEMSRARFGLATVALLGYTGALLRVTGWLVTLSGATRAVVAPLSILLMAAGTLRALGWESSRSATARLLVRASWVQAGLLLVGVAAGGVSGRAATLLYLSVVAFSSLGAYGIAGASTAATPAAHGTEGSRRGGKGLLGAVALGLVLCTLAGAPPSVGLWGRLLVLRVAVEAGAWWVFAAALAATLAGLHYYCRPLLELFSHEADAAGTSPRSPRRLGALAMAGAGLVVLALGIVPAAWLGLIERVALELF